MDSVTSKFNKYDLSDICSELVSLSDPNHPVPPLPKYVGGSKVHLLLGIKNTNLDPVWIKTLPSGVAVYQSVFKDIWGSDLIFAGPHKSFTNGNKVSNVNHLSLEYILSLVSVKTNKILGLTRENMLRLLTMYWV